MQVEFRTIETVSLVVLRHAWLMAGADDIHVRVLQEASNVSPYVTVIADDGTFYYVLPAQLLPA